MPRYRIEIEHRHTTTREEWIDADNADAARRQAKALDIFTLQRVGDDSYESNIHIELCEED